MVTDASVTVTPTGSPETVSVTVPLALLPFKPLTNSSVCAIAPAGTASEFGWAERVMVGATTPNCKNAWCERVPPTPWTSMLTFAGTGAVTAAVRVTTRGVPGAEVGTIEKLDGLAVTPGGNPVMVTWTGELNPL